MIKHKIDIAKYHNNPVLYIVLNGELKMSAGKAVAQAAHASMMLTNNERSLFMQYYERTVIVLEAENTSQMNNIYEYLQKSYNDPKIYIDEGVNEVSPFSKTALAVLLSGEDRGILSGLPLYNIKNKKRRW